ncbi:hypothetical protein NE865_12944 [Phthorimaea operculella]|nr:hypothetical protein NE865_12944 [Phthorimaea operculella]
MCLSNFTLTISEYCPLEKLPAAFGLHMVSKGVLVVLIGPLIEYCPLEKLPAAFGLHMVSKGVLVVLIGPLIGFVRDYTDSYSMCIHVQNAMIMSCVLVWGIEYVYVFTRRRKVVQI